MPKVSAAHLEQRRRQVLEAALRCFARDGFHATSMQDVVAESGLSAGAVYRYFPSKAELVAAGAELVLARNQTTLATLLERPDTPSPAETVGTMLTSFLKAATAGDYDLSRVAVSAWAEALRDPELAVVAGRTYLGVRGALARLCERWQAEGQLREDLDVEVTSQLLLSGLLGFAVQRLILGDVDPERYAAGLVALTGQVAPPGDGDDAG